MSPRVQAALLLFAAAACVSFGTPVRDLAPGELASPAPAPVAQPDAEDELTAAVARYVGERGSVLSREEIEAVARAVVEESSARELDPWLVVAVIEVESRYDPFAVSRRGAMGLMQVRTPTGAALADELGLLWEGARTLFDPASNIKLGVAYLDGLRGRFGKLDTALAAYNLGPSAVRRRIRRGSPIPRGYVRRVRAAYAEAADLPISAS